MQQQYAGLLCLVLLLFHPAAGITKLSLTNQCSSHAASHPQPARQARLDLSSASSVSQAKRMIGDRLGVSPELHSALVLRNPGAGVALILEFGGDEVERRG